MVRNLARYIFVHMGKVNFIRKVSGPPRITGQPLVRAHLWNTHLCEFSAISNSAKLWELTEGVSEFSSREAGV